MSRSTQYIGLTLAARKHVKSAIRTEKYEMTFGMFDESVFGTIYYMPDGSILKEVGQVTPWSSGPMILTCLRSTSGEKLFQWVEDREVYGEVDCKTGRYWV
jgi:hypothetical protein